MDKETSSNDYSKIDKDTRDELAERLAFAGKVRLPYQERSLP